MTESFFPEENTATNPPEQIESPERLSDAPPEPPADDEVGSEESRLAALIAYVPFLCFIPLLNMRDNKTALFHARQGVILFLIELLAAVFLIDGISDFFFKGVLLAAVALSAAGIYSALQGKKFRLPVIGDLADKTKL
ncbi:MAG: hypothetical protein HY851_08860 [candidate division Zixibacteria bacterium]|nr:hypothetical protein [candidate division Zixibacteria bacterium]